MTEFYILHVMGLIMLAFIGAVYVVLFLAFAKPALRNTMAFVVLWVLAATAYWLLK